MGQTYVGTFADDVFFGLDTSDTYIGEAGNDTLIGGDGADVLFGGDGDDTLWASGNTISRAGEIMRGGNGNDTYILGANLWTTSIFGENGVSGTADEIRFTRHALSDFHSITHDGSRLFFHTSNGFGADVRITVSGFGAFETYRFADTILNPQDILARIGTGADDRLTADGVLFGGAGDDHLTGGLGADRLVGGVGHDTLEGGAGNDTLVADGRDIMFGGAGDDVYLIGADGRGQIRDDLGTDRIIFQDLTYAALGGPKQTDTTLFVGGLEILNNAVEHFEFADGTELAAAEIGGLAHTDGDDLISGLHLDDNLFGGAGDDLILGGKGDDTLFGGDGRDRLSGGGGDDTLIAGGNSSYDEYLRGGSGNDTYVITGAEGRVMLLSEREGFGTDDRIVFETLAHDAFDRVYLASNGAMRFVFTHEDGDKGVITVRDRAHFESFIFADGVTLTGESIDILLTSAPGGSILPSMPSVAPSMTVPVNLAEIAGTDGQPFVFAHAFHTPEGSVQHMTPGARWTSANQSNAIEIVTASTDDTVIRNMNSGGDLFFGQSGNDSVNGGSGADALFGGQGDDTLDGGTYSDFVSGGAGNDRLFGGTMNDVLFGGEGNDWLEGGFALDALFGGAGADVIISRSDGGQPDKRIDDVPAIVVTEFAGRDRDMAGVATNDALYGGAGADLFVFEFTVGAAVDANVLLPDNPDGFTLLDDMGTEDRSDDIYLVDGVYSHAGVQRQIKATDIPIDWSIITGLNETRHAHWMDGIGDDVIHDFDVGVDDIAFIGHTVRIHSVEQRDVDGDGRTDTVVTLKSHHTHLMGGIEMPLSHHNDLLGTVTIMGATLTKADLAGNVVDIPVHEGHALTMTGNARIDAYLQETLTDAAGAALPTAALINQFASFENIRLAGSYYASNLATVKTYGDAQSVSQIGSEAADIIIAPDTGGFLHGGAGDDMLLGSKAYTIQFGRDFIEGGAGNDLISGAAQDDILFGGAGDDVILGGGEIVLRPDGKPFAVGDEDLIFGGDGNDVLSGGPQSDMLDGGAGDDVILSASDIYVGAYDHKYALFGTLNDFESNLGFVDPRDFRALNDYLTGGAGADAFIFDVLNADVGGVMIHASFGIDTIFDFDAASGDTLQINVHGGGHISHQIDTVMIDGRESAVINIVSDRSDDLTTIHNPVTGYDLIETDHKGSVGEILLVGLTAADAEAALDLVVLEEALTATDYYGDVLLM